MTVSKAKPAEGELGRVGPTEGGGTMGSMGLQIVYRPIDELIPYAKNARTHPKDQIDTIKQLMLQFGWTNPVLLDGANGMITGHGRIVAARALWEAGEEIKRCPRGMVPCIDIHGLSDAEKRAYILADNASAERAGWDGEILGAEVAELKMADFDLGLTGFADAELAALLDTGPKIREQTEAIRPKRFLRILVSVPVDNALEAREIVDQLTAIPNIEILYGAN